MWQARRTADKCAELEAGGLLGAVRRNTGLVWDPYFSATKVSWILDHVRGARARAARGELAFGTIDSWLIWKLTGGNAHVTDYTNASRTLLFNIRSLGWDPRLCRAFKVPVEMLPKVVPSAGVIGETAPGILGPTSIPIAGIAGDQQAALFGQACFKPGMVNNTYMGAKVGWHTAEQWPLPNQVPTSYYFSSGSSGSINSVNDGILIPEAPVEASASDVYQVDYSSSQGDIARGSAVSQVLFMYNQLPNEEKGLTYTTDPLESQLEITGHPIIHLWVASSAKDGDFFVYLSDVAANGHSQYITEGKLRASHRALSAPPYNNIGLPYHPSNEADIADLPDEPVELVFDLLPTSYVFGEGHRIRVTITCADKDNYATPVLDPAPTVSIYRDAEHASYIELPVIPGN